MKHVNLTPLVAKILSKELSVRAAAKAAGMSPSTFSDRLNEHPDYVKAKQQGLTRPAPDTAPVNVEALRTNPAVLAVVNEGLSLRKAIERHPDNGTTTAATLGKWIKQAYPDFVSASPTGGGRRSTEEMVAPDIDAIADRVLSRASALNLDPVKLAKWVLKQVEERYVAPIDA